MLKLGRYQPQKIQSSHLNNACSVANIPRGVLGTRVNLDMCQIRVDRNIRFEYRYDWTWKFLIQKEKVADSKISDYVWTGSQFPSWKGVIQKELMVWLLKGVQRTWIQVLEVNFSDFLIKEKEIQFELERDSSYLSKNDWKVGWNLREMALGLS